MAEWGGVLYRWLKDPRVYEAVQQMMRADGIRSEFATRHVCAKSGDRIIDIGCGPAQILRFLPRVDYEGWEPNSDYVDQARARFGDRGKFHVGLFTAEAASTLEQVDIAIVSAVLHHLNDAEARELFRLLHSVLKPGGRVVTLDNVYTPRQNPLAKALIALDRGRDVRTPQGYDALAADLFEDVAGEVVHKRFPPYTYYLMQARKR